MALGLGLDLLAKTSSDVPHALRMLIDSFGMQHTSYLRDFEVQTSVVDALWSRVMRADGEMRELFIRLFVATAEPLLRTHFQTHESKSDRVINLVTFDVPVTPALVELRITIWRHVADLLRSQASKSIALELVRRHATDSYRVSDGNVLKSDAAVVIPALEEGLDPGTYTDCAAAQAYFQLLRLKRVALDPDLERRRSELEARCAGPTLELSELLVEDWEDRQERRGLGWEEYARLRQQELRQYVATRDLVALRQLISGCVIILNDLRAEHAGSGNSGSSHKEWQVKQGLVTMLQAVAERAPALFVELVTHYLESGDPLELEPQGIVPALLDAAGPARAYEILRSSDFGRKGAWLTGFFVWLPANDVTAERLAQLYAHFEKATVIDLFRDLDFLAKYETIDRRVVPKVVEILVTKAKTDKRIGFVLADTFDARDVVGGRAREIFGASRADTELLQQAYFAASMGDSHFDYNAAGFSALLDLDPTFGGAWVDFRYTNADKRYLSRHDDSRDYSDLWLRDDYMIVMRLIFDRVRGNDKWDMFSYADAFVRLPNDEPQPAEIRRRQKQLFLEWVREAADDADQMSFVFGRVLALPPEDRRELWAAFLAENHLVADFKKLPLEPSTWGWSGSQVPLLESRVEFLESLLPLFDKIELLDHRRDVEERIASLREYIEQEKKRDFLER